MLMLNCDLGESFGSWTMGRDADVMPHIDQANIACGFHGGDPLTMRRTLALAAQHKVSVGAHPAYPDLVGFGRRPMNLSADEIKIFIYGIRARLNSCDQSVRKCSFHEPLNVASLIPLTHKKCFILYI